MLMEAYDVWSVDLLAFVRVALVLEYDPPNLLSL